MDCCVNCFFSAILIYIFFVICPTISVVVFPPFCTMLVLFKFLMKNRLFFGCCWHVAGKSTVACALSHELHSRGKLTYILDGDNVRHGLCKDLGFNAQDRAENIRRMGEHLWTSFLSSRVIVRMCFGKSF